MQQPQVQQESVISKTKQQEIKQTEFREYIARSDVVLAMVKFLLSIKNSKELPENPLNTLTDYFGEYKDEKLENEYEDLQKQYNVLDEENELLAEKIEQLKQQIVQEQERKKQEEEEELERQRQEEANKKGSKKPGKK